MSYKVKAEAKKEKDKGVMEKAGEKLGEIKETVREAYDVVAGKVGAVRNAIPSPSILVLRLLVCVG